jgi:hypothetical protein
MTPQEQSAAFEREVQRLIDAGELDPTEAADALNALVRRSRKAGDDTRPPPAPKATP